MNYFLASVFHTGHIGVRRYLYGLEYRRHGPGSLRQAVLDANGAAGADTINFDSGVFNTPQTITLASTLTINGTNDTLTINGPGTARGPTK